MTENKINRCNAAGICTAHNLTDMKTCKHYEREQTAFPGLCVFYAHRADDCLCAAANEEARQ